LKVASGIRGAGERVGGRSQSCRGTSSRGDATQTRFTVNCPLGKEIKKKVDNEWFFNI
jgi:hypothetical protein